MEEVIKQLPMKRILLETDSPHLIAPEHRKSHYNSPYGVEVIAERIAQLKGINIETVLHQTLSNTKTFYGLSQ